MSHSAFVTPQTICYSFKPQNSCVLCRRVVGNSVVPIVQKTLHTTLYFGAPLQGTRKTLRRDNSLLVLCQQESETSAENERTEEISGETESPQGSSTSTEAQDMVFGNPSLSTEATAEELEPRPYYKLYMEQKQLEKRFQRHERDTGSTEVQIARLTARINHLTEHAKVHKHDYATIRGLIGLVNRRKRLLKYLRRQGDDRVIELAEQLHIRVSRELVESKK